MTISLHIRLNQQTFLAGVTYMLSIYAHWDVSNDNDDDKSITESTTTEENFISL